MLTSTRDFLGFVWALRPGAIKDSIRSVVSIILLSALGSQVVLPVMILLYEMQAPCSFQFFVRAAVGDCPVQGGRYSLPLWATPFALLSDAYFVYYTFCQAIFCICEWIYGIACLDTFLKK